MIKTSTLSSLKLSPTTKEKKEEQKLSDPDGYRDEGPSEAAINNILNYSKSLKVMNSEMVRTIEIVSQ